MQPGSAPGSKPADSIRRIGHDSTISKISIEESLEQHYQSGGTFDLRPALDRTSFPYLREESRGGQEMDDIETLKRIFGRPYATKCCQRIMRRGYRRTRYWSHRIWPVFRLIAVKIRYIKHQLGNIVEFGLKFPETTYRRQQQKRVPRPDGRYFMSSTRQVANFGFSLSIECIFNIR